MIRKFISSIWEKAKQEYIKQKALGLAKKIYR
jgi:hypothetical protein